MKTSNRNVFFLALFLRLFCLFIVKSYFVPDEYWQSLEIAHRTVFGYGYITWEWKKAIRSFFYPSCFALAFKVLEIFSLDYKEILTFVPRLLQAIFSAFADLYFWLFLNKSLLKHKRTQLLWTYFMWLMCLFVNYCSTRTLTNTAELNFSIIALYYFPWEVKDSKQKIHFLWFVGLACLSRPTAFIQWLPLCFYNIISNPKPVRYLMTYCSIILKIICFSIAIDFLFYKKIVLTPLYFVLYNGQYNIGIHYGAHPWFWYLIIGIPVVLGPIFTLFYLAVFRIIKKIYFDLFKKKFNNEMYARESHCRIEMLLFFTIIWTIFWYSLVPHKEFRFIIPLVPIMIYFSSISLTFKNSLKRHKYNFEFFIVFISLCAILFNFIGLLFLGQWHQVGPITVISKLADISKENPSNYSFLFLTPCHTTPLYSHLHVNVTTQFLTCEPNFNSEHMYKDESDIFYENPLRWLHDYALLKNHCSFPTHIIFYEDIKESIRLFLESYNYTKLDSVYHSHFPQDKQSNYFEIFHSVKNYTCFT